MSMAEPNPFDAYDRPNPFDAYDLPPPPPSSMGNFLAQEFEPAVMRGPTDIAKSAVSGLGQGVAGLAGLPGLAQQGLEAGVGAIGQGLGLPPQQLSPRFQVPGPSQITRALGADYTPQTMPGQYTQTAASFVPGALLGGVPRSATQLAGQLGKYALAPGIASEAAGQATSGTAAEPYARIGAAVLTPSAVGMAASLTRPASRVREFTAQVIGRVDPSLKTATDADLAFARSRLASQMDEATKGYTWTANKAYRKNLGRAIKDYKRVTTPAERNKLLLKQLKQRKDIQAIKGADYTAIRSDIADQAFKATRLSDKKALLELRKATDDAMTYSLAKVHGRPDLANQLKDTRARYALLSRIEKTPRTPDGYLSPRAFEKIYSRYPAKRAATDLGELPQLAAQSLGQGATLGEVAIPGALQAGGLMAGHAAAGPLGAWMGSLIGRRLGPVIGPNIPVPYADPLQRALWPPLTTPPVLGAPARAGAVLARPEQEEMLGQTRLRR